MRTGILLGIITLLSLNTLYAQWYPNESIEKSYERVDFFKVQFINENLGFALGNRMIYKTIDGGKIWNEVLETSYRISDMLFNGESKGWAVTWENVNDEMILFETNDGGQNWIERNMGYGYPLRIIDFLDEHFGFIYGADYVPEEGYKAVILKTTDGGNNWTANFFEPEGSWNSLTILNQQIGVAVGSRNLIYRSEDGGLSWNSIGIDHSAGSFSSVKFVDSNYCLAFWGNYSAYVYSTDQGKTWTKKNLPSQYWGTNEAYVVDSSNWFAVGRNGQVVKTENGGETWEFIQLETYDELNSVQFLDENTGFFAGTYNIIGKTTDGFDNWEYIYPFFNTAINNLNFFDEKNGAAVANSGIVFITKDSGNTWNFVDTGTRLDLMEVCFLSKDTIVAAGGILSYWDGESSVIILSYDGGSAWEEKYSSLDHQIFSVSFRNRVTGFAVGSQGKILRTDDSGETWNAITIPGKPTLKVVKCADSITTFTAGHSEVGYVSRLFKNIEQNSNWETIELLNEKAIEDLFFLNSDTGWITNRNQIYKTTNGGNDWIQLKEIKHGDNSIFFLDENTGWVCGNGIYRTTDGGEIWGSQGIFADITVSGLNSIYMMDSSKGFCAGHHVILETGNGGGVVGVELISELPRSFNLSQNYPNPFNPTTTIEYSIPVNSLPAGQAGRKDTDNINQNSENKAQNQGSSIQNREQVSVQLKVYDVLGREVATLVDKPQAPGNYKVQFDASGLASGVYFYRLKYGSFIQSKKMLMIK